MTNLGCVVLSSVVRRASAAATSVSNSAISAWAVVSPGTEMISCPLASGFSVRTTLSLRRASEP